MIEKLSKYARYYSSIRYIESLNNISGSYQKTHLGSHPNPSMYLERMQDFLDLIGNPEKDFKFIHITGTSGKGSVSSMVHETLVKNGKKSGLFTSPFVTSTIEKIRVGNYYIEPHIFANIVESLKPHIDTATLSSRHGMPSYFEIILAIALLYFKKEKCEYVVLEVGLGGRYDATNIIKNPLVTAITNIGLDHTQILGKTKKKIALDKSGIIKNGSTFFTTEEDPQLQLVFKKECKKNEAFYNECNIRGLKYNEKNELLSGSICHFLKIIKNVKDVAIPEILPAKFEIIEKSPLVIIDVAHNVSKMQSTVHNLTKIKYHKLHAVIAISADKNWKDILDELLPKVDILYVTRFNVHGRSCVNPVEIIRYAKKYIANNKISFYSDPIQAFSKARGAARTKDALLVTGSFYLAGDIRNLYCPEDKILKQRNSRVG